MMDDTDFLRQPSQRGGQCALGQGHDSATSSRARRQQFQVNFGAFPRTLYIDSVTRSVKRFVAAFFMLWNTTAVSFVDTKLHGTEQLLRSCYWLSKSSLFCLQESVSVPVQSEMNLCEISSSHGGEYEAQNLLGCTAVSYL
jgi:hypothetical protein